MDEGRPIPNRFGWSWAEGDVDESSEWFHLRHRDRREEVAAIVGPAKGRTFPVRLLADDPAVLEDVRRELDIYLLDVGGPRPWQYARYHCTTFSNMYSSVHWSYVTPLSRALASEDVRAVTIRQPWAWAIVHADKDVENRTWSIRYRGPLLIHAGSAKDADGHDRLGQMGLHPPEDLVRGAVIGVVQVVDCIRGASSRWALDGMWQWVLEDPLPVDPPTRCAGRQGLWRPDPDLLRRIKSS